MNRDDGSRGHLPIQGLHNLRGDLMRRLGCVLACAAVLTACSFKGQLGFDDADRPRGQDAGSAAPPDAGKKADAGDGGGAPPDAGRDGGSDAGADGGADAGVDGGCVRLSCETRGLSCGPVADNCGDPTPLDCGSCAGALTCAGANRENTCGLPKADGRCSAGGWCWVSPQLTGNDLQDVWAVSPTDVWAVGGGGTALHWDGTAWSSVATGTTAGLVSVHGTAHNDVWAVGGTVLHWNGIGWSELPCPLLPYTLTSVFAISRTDVWVVGGGNGSLAHWDGVRWTLHPLGQMVDVWAASSTDIWGVGKAGRIFHGDGKSWAQVASGTSADLYTISGRGPTDVYAGGVGTLLRWDGTQWAHAPGAVGTGTVTGIALGAPGSMWLANLGVVGWDGALWTGLPGDKAPVRSLALAGSNSLWAVGDDGELLWFDGVAASRRRQTQSDLDIRIVWGASPSDIWAFASPPSNVAASSEVLHWDGLTWTRTSVPWRAQDVFGFGANDIWVVTDAPGLVHWQGGGWNPTTVPGQPKLRSIWGSAANDLWAVGEAGAVVHWNGSAWTPVVVPQTGDLRGVWGSGASDVRIVGDGFIVRWNGTAWSSSLSGINAWDIWASAPNDFWIRGDSTLHRWNATGLAAMTCPVDPFALSGTGPNDVWAVGYYGQIAHWDGTAWTLQDRVASKYLYTVHAVNAQTVIVGGDSGQLLRRN